MGLDTVSMIDTACNTVLATVPVGISPKRVAISPDGKHAYVTNYVGSGADGSPTQNSSRERL
jgi:YVTN family beta-propeller protein